MKRIITSVLLCIVLCFAFVLTSAASQSPLVVDNADLLTPSERTELTERLDSIREKYNYDLVILTVRSLDGKSSMAFADDFYDYNGYGYGTNYDGTLFLVSLSPREYWTSSCGRGISVCGDSFTDYIDNKTDVVSLLSDGNYYKAFEHYIDNVERRLEREVNGGNGLSDAEKTEEIIKTLLICLVISLIIGLMYAFVLLSKMKTARIQKYAADYVRKDSFDLLAANDIFTYSHTTKCAKPQDDSSTHTSSSGRSHSGGGGSF